VTVDQPELRAGAKVGTENGDQIVSKFHRQPERRPMWSSWMEHPGDEETGEPAARHGCAKFSIYKEVSVADWMKTFRPNGGRVRGSGPLADSRGCNRPEGEHGMVWNVELFSWAFGCGRHRLWVLGYRGSGEISVAQAVRRRRPGHRQATYCPTESAERSLGLIGREEKRVRGVPQMTWGRRSALELQPANEIYQWRKANIPRRSAIHYHPSGKWRLAGRHPYDCGNGPRVAQDTRKPNGY